MISNIYTTTFQFLVKNLKKSIKLKARQVFKVGSKNSLRSFFVHPLDQESQDQLCILRRILISFVPYPQSAPAWARLQVSSRRHSTNSQAAARGFAC